MELTGSRNSTWSRDHLVTLAPAAHLLGVDAGEGEGEGEEERQGQGGGATRIVISPLKPMEPLYGLILKILSRPQVQL